MGLLDGILGGSLGKVVEAVGGVLDGLSTTQEEKDRAQIQLQALLQERDSEVEQTLRRELEAKERILVAELQQGDNFTKRARPMVVYTGLLISLASAVARIIGVDVDPATLVPVEFWYAWGGITTTWVVGRTFEKRGANGAAVRAVTGASRLGI